MEPLLGQISAFGFNFAPRGWMECWGQLLSISQNSALFSLLGTTYGGDGRTTFALPDLRGRASLGDGNGPGLTPRQLGGKSGSETNTLTISNLPSHNHLITGTATGTPQVNNQAGQQDSPEGAVPAVASDDSYTDSSNAIGLANSIQINTTGLTIGIAGGNFPVNNMQPFLVINWCIATQGIFPSRS
ncbi:MAG: phage tail protein [Bacteroidia bacterium]|nr:phage tail protein [Bacteroidia bacterium]